MADDNKQNEEQKKEANKQLDPICALSVPTIITALHQNALAHCDAASKNVRLLNSAINEKDDGKLKSAGEHIISVVPLKEGESVQKTTAIEVIKQYVQWFVGPDLASKINDSTVKSLTETPENKNKDKNDDKEEKQSTEVKESHILSFSQYLLEADDSDDETGEGDDSDDETGAGDDSDDETGEGNDDDDASGEGDDSDDSSGEGDDKNDKNDENVESKIGYYIAYNLKVDGLKSTTLKDAMKKFAATLFDDLKITADGIFGSGQSFTVGDVKKAVGDLFGSVDPDDLKYNISNKLEKKYDGTNTKILSKEKILRDYKKQLDVKQKTAIDAAENSVVIEVPNKIKKELNTRIIADIVTSSIKGLFKKFKHQIKKDDIIQISIDKTDNDDNTANKNDKNKDINVDNILSKPSPEKFEHNITQTYNNFSDIYAYLSQLVEKIKANKKIKDNEFASSFVTLFDDQKKKAGETINDKTDLKDSSFKKMKEHFSDFITKYTELYNKYKDDKKESSDKTQISEMEDIISSIIQEAVMRRFYGNVDRHRDRIKTKNDIMSILLGTDYSLNEDSEDDQLNSSGNETEEEETGSGDDDEDSSSSPSNTNASSDKNDETDDLYIIPMKGLKSKDD